MLDRKTYKDASTSLGKMEIAYISQLFDQNCINMFTWDQIKRCKNMSSKGRVAKQYKKLEEIILKNMNSRLVKEEFKLEEINTQSIRKKANKVTKDRRKKEWVLCNSQNNRVIGKIRSKEDRKTLIEYWETREDSESLRTELVRCTGYENQDIFTENVCIMQRNNTDDILDISGAIYKQSNVINILPKDMLIEEEIETQQRRERKLIELREVDSVEIEIINSQGLKEEIATELKKILRNNIRYKKEEPLIFFTDRSLKGKIENSIKTNRIGIGQAQISLGKDEVIEQFSARVNGWLSSTIAELIAIWSVLLAVPIEEKITIYTDSNLAIRGIRRELANNVNSRILKKKNPIMITNIVDIIRGKKINLELVKVKSHSNDKWNEYADKLAKQGLNRKEEIEIEKIESTRFKFQVSWKEKKIDIPVKLLVKLIYNVKTGMRWKESEAIKKLEPESNDIIYDWTGYWNRQKDSSGVKCNSNRISVKRSTLIKCLAEKLPVMKELNKRRPQVYDTPNCRVCEKEIEEMQEHIAECEVQKHLWKRIEKVTITSVQEKIEKED